MRPLSSSARRLLAVWGVTGAAVLAAALAPPVTQDPAYHRFAGDGPWLGVPHGANVLSNVAFLVAGAAGLAVCRRAAQARLPWAVAFGGVLLTAFGSAWYHLDPGDARLAWDRLPMTLAFAGLAAALVGERVGERAGRGVLAALLVAGPGSVVAWRATGDLRPYGLVQFGPMLVLPVVVALWPGPRTAAWAAAAGAYGLAKGLELADARLLAAIGVAGHPWKHLAAAGAAAVLAWSLVRERRSAALGYLEKRGQAHCRHP